MQVEHNQLKSTNESLINENTKLRDELSSVKKDLEALQTEDVQVTEPSDPETPVEFSTCLIIGDSILRDFDDSTFENSCVQSISGGTVADIFRELEKRKDLDTFKNIIIHAGTNDISRNVAVEECVASMEAIITLVMVTAPTASVFISGICPRTKTPASNQIEIMNAAFQDLAVRLDCRFIDAGMHMTYRNGSIDSTQLSDGLHLSARGVETLATLFAESVDELTISTEPWQEVSRKPNKRQVIDQEPRSRTSQSRSRDVHANSRTNSSSHRNGSRHNQRNHNHQHRDYRRKSYSGCYNCGLKNHNQKTCHHKDRVKCNKCNRLGHKANYCFNSSGNHGSARDRY